MNEMMLYQMRRPLKRQRADRRIIMASILSVSVAYVIAFPSLVTVSSYLPEGPDVRFTESPGPVASTAADDQAPSGPAVDWVRTELARGMQSPDGLAFSTVSGAFYVSDESAASVLCVEHDGNTYTLINPETPVYRDDGGGRIRVTGLRSPEGLALDSKNVLYVVEDLPGGRLISFDLQSASGAQDQPAGLVVPLPDVDQDIAWESIAVNGAGEILLAGSSVESALAGQTGTLLFHGVILFRDASGVWWKPVDDPMSSYSAVCFSPDGTFAYFACEAFGSVGCLNLESRIQQIHYAPHRFQEPEGLAVFPDGTAVVAEENGSIYRYDPFTGIRQRIYDNGSTIESLMWEPAGHRLVVTDDAGGTVFSLQADLAFISASEFKPAIPYASTPEYRISIPDTCPPYLAGVLGMAGFNADEAGGQSFGDFARRTQLIAVDAVAEPADDTTGGITRVQFVILSPQLFGIDMGQISGPVSGFVAVDESGGTVHTAMRDREVLHTDLWTGITTLLGGRRIAIPFPFGTELSREGMATVHFMGFGETPDYHVILNAREPDDSYLYVAGPGRHPECYNLALPQGADAAHWVIALRDKGPEVWQRLGEIH